MGIDVEGVRRQILADGRDKLIPHLVRGSLHLKAEGAVLCIENGRVRTVRLPEMLKGRRPQRRQPRGASRIGRDDEPAV